ncbi:hypothetical protein NEUTE1DRAFT_114832 [Neurospora tetrasperma FGSC 2508]|uniref:Uncharacterized protein n=1 Tax=Neurospora tetrasperma (strain FGSC 2508 / ATCC MYA-4615 / P0657) TaxID=510951 RepID=F8N0C5_NEUT8|nr:uncharacterized protein NEUTE1DRAFT_114832 [Neurospora tetrasperma FGSC 2508]EGO52953.1 hypothetical protein NEUTE1DRAFT_114832 [Neurospora tetrasperma FGSC 2508]
MTDLGAKRFPFVSPFVALAYYVYRSNAESLVTLPQDSEWAAEPSTRPQMSGCNGQRARYRTVHQWQFADAHTWAANTRREEPGELQPPRPSNYVPNKKSLPSNELGTNEMPMTELPLLRSFLRSDSTSKIFGLARLYYTHTLDYTRYQEVLGDYKNVTSWLSVA